MTDGLGTADLTWMRELIDTTLPDTCAIVRGTATFDSEGGNKTTWGTVAGTVYCRMDMRSGKEETTAGAIQPYSTYVLSLTHDQSILTKDRIIFNGGTFNVISVNASQSWIGVKRAVLEKV